MIEKVAKFKTTDGSEFDNIETAQIYEEISEYFKFLKTHSELCLECPIIECCVRKNINDNEFYLSMCDNETHNYFIDESIRNFNNIKKYWEDKLNKLSDNLLIG